MGFSSATGPTLKTVLCRIPLVVGRDLNNQRSFAWGGVNSGAFDSSERKTLVFESH